MSAGQWYRDGSVSVTTGSDYVLGAGTAWSSQAEIGDRFSVTLDGVTESGYEVVQVIDNYTLRINAPYKGATTTEAEYAIERNWTGRWSLQTRLVADTAELNREMRRLLETQLRGPTGADGADGNRIHNGNGPPSISLGVESDYYLDDLSWNIYRKDKTLWELIGNVQGEQGIPGLRGTQLTDGDGAPATSYGQDGDYYLDRQTGNMYRKTAQTGWHVTMNLTGPKGESVTGPKGDSIVGLTGEAGSKWLAGSGEPPDASAGRDGDMYMVSAGTGRGRFYQKIVGAWTYQGTTQGLVGAAGAQGAVGLVSRGEWLATEQYETRDFVTRQGSSWYARKPSLGVAPAENEYWTLLASKGESGTGTGDMSMDVYDPGKTGVVLAAQEAGHAIIADTAALASEAEAIGPNKVDHNTAKNLQGGRWDNPDAAEMYHLDADQHAALQNNAALSATNTVAAMSDLEHALEGKADTGSVAALTQALNTKVDKEDGKGLSAEDYTAEEKKKLAGLDAALGIKADKSALASLSDTIAKKADASTVESLLSSVKSLEASITAVTAVFYYNLTPTCSYSSKIGFFCRDYKTVSLSLQITGTSLAANGLREVATLPTGYRPIETTYFACIATVNSGGLVSTYGCIATDGKISIYNNMATYLMTSIFCGCAFLAGG